jgi:hypothetical protein
MAKHPMCSLAAARLHPLRVFFTIFIFLMCLVALSVSLYMSFAIQEYTAREVSPPFLSTGSFTPTTSTPAVDNVRVLIKLTNCDLTSHSANMRIKIFPLGVFRLFNNVPSGNLTVQIDNVLRRFPQIDTTTGYVAILPFDQPLVLEGDPNVYPFDFHQASFLVSGFWNDDPLAVVPIFVDFENLAASFQVSASITRPTVPKDAPFTSTPLRSVSLDVSVAVQISRTTSQKIFSVFTNLLMYLLALTVLMLAIDSMLTLKRVELPILALCTAMMFALPALRNSQPLVPPIGTVADVASFLQAEFIISVISIGLIFFYIVGAARATIREETVKDAEHQTAATTSLVMGGAGLDTIPMASVIM